MVPFFLIILLSMLPSGLLDALTDAGIGLSQTSMFIDAIDAIVSRTGLFGFAILCLVLYVFSSACLPVMVGCLLRVTYLQQVRELIMSILTHETLFSILNCLCAVFASFALGILAARHHAMLFRLLAIIHQAVRTIKSNGVLDNSMNVAKHAWPIVDSLVLLTGCLYEVSCLSEQQLCLLALSILLIIFVVFTGVLILAIITFNLVLGHFLAIESTKLCVSFVKASDILSHISTITHDLFLFIYMSDGTIETGDLPMPPDLTIPTATTAVHLVNHTRTVSHSSHISTATHISAHLSKASGPRTAIPQESRGSTPSADLSGQSSTPSRPISRSSHPTTISDLDQCIRIVDSCMERIQELQTETQLLRQKNGHVHQLEVEVELLRARDEHSRRDRFQDEQKFQSMLKGFEFLEAVNAELLAENQDLRQALDRNEEEGNALLKEFVQSFCPQHLDLFSDSGLTSSLSAPKSSSQQPVTPGGDHIPVQTPVKRSLHLPDTPSSGPSLPFSPRTPVIRSVGHISPTSLIKPLHPKTPSGPGLPTPEAMKRQFDPTVKIVVPRCPTTVSSRNSLPCPSSASTNSSYPFEFEPVDHSLSPSPKTIKKYDQGIRLFPAKPGLPCPMRQVFGDRIPEEHSPTIPEDSPSLPRPTPIPVPSRFGRVSVHSLNRPYFGGHGGYGDYAQSPLANRGKRVDPISSIQRPRYKTPAARARAQRFFNPPRPGLSRPAFLCLVQRLAASSSITAAERRLRSLLVKGGGRPDSHARRLIKHTFRLLVPVQRNNIINSDNINPFLVKHHPTVPSAREHLSSNLLTRALRRRFANVTVVHPTDSTPYHQAPITQLHPSFPKTLPTPPDVAASERQRTRVEQLLTRALRRRFANATVVWPPVHSL